MHLHQKSIMLFGLALFWFGSVVQAQGKPERIRFQKGSTATTIKSRFAGFESKDFILGAQKGQTMTLKLESANAYFVVFPAKGEPLEMGPRTEWSERLMDSGDYIVRVFMMRSAARRKGSTSNYTLKIEIK
ncbi:MAG TPA: hypothetical protein VFZ34_28200 [Blastocatellia bacterium]|nr:hypothetical protein [Blastocatellia bacterium]